MCPGHTNDEIDRVFSFNFMQYAQTTSGIPDFLKYIFSPRVFLDDDDVDDDFNILPDLEPTDYFSLVFDNMDAAHSETPHVHVNTSQ